MGRVEAYSGIAQDKQILRGCTLPEVRYEGISYVCPSWEHMGVYTFELAQQIIDSGEPFDRVIALAKGGWTWTRTLMDYLKIDAVSSMRIKSYSGVNKAAEPRILQPLQDPVYGERVLLFDEVIDSGETVALAEEYIKVMGATNVKVAALCYKPRSIFIPDYYAFNTETWVVFPHEIREFIDESCQKWKGNGVSTDDIVGRLGTIGLPPDQVTYFVKLLQ